MKITKKQNRWLGAHKALEEYRRIRKETKKEDKKPVVSVYIDGLDLYSDCLKKVHIGKTLLDVGCGSQAIKRVVPKETIYTGLDPFPVVDDTVKMMIEQCNFENESFETVVCFAALDYTYDLSKALRQMSRIAACNIVILTYIDIGPKAREGHACAVSLQDLINNLPDYNLTLKQEIIPNLFLFEFTKS